MTDAQIAQEIGEAVLDMVGTWACGNLAYEDGQYRLFVNTIPLSADGAMHCLRKMGWTVEMRDGSIMMSHDD